MYHFLSGYTAKVAGTERGIVEPQATFSSCFGAAFMTLHPTRYADLFLQKLQKHKVNCYLVNTGWTGGYVGGGGWSAGLFVPTTKRRVCCCYCYPSLLVVVVWCIKWSGVMNGEIRWRLTVVAPPPFVLCCAAAVRTALASA